MSFLGRSRVVEYLLHQGAAPNVGMRSGMSGFHYAASCGKLEVVKVMIELEVPMETKNRQGGTVLRQAIWNAINEYEATHAEIIERLIKAGATVHPGTLIGGGCREVASKGTKKRVELALENS